MRIEPTRGYEPQRERFEVEGEERVSRIGRVKELRGDTIPLNIFNMLFHGDKVTNSIPGQIGIGFLQFVLTILSLGTLLAGKYVFKNSYWIGGAIRNNLTPEEAVRYTNLYSRHVYKPATQQTRDLPLALPREKAFDITLLNKQIEDDVKEIERLLEEKPTEALPLQKFEDLSSLILRINDAKAILTERELPGRGRQLSPKDRLILSRAIGKSKLVLNKVVSEFTKSLNELFTTLSKDILRIRSGSIITYDSFRSKINSLIEFVANKDIEDVFFTSENALEQLETLNKKINEGEQALKEAETTYLDNTLKEVQTIEKELTSSIARVPAERIIPVETLETAATFFSTVNKSMDLIRQEIPLDVSEATNKKIEDLSSYQDQVLEISTNILERLKVSLETIRQLPKEHLTEKNRQDIDKYVLEFTRFMVSEDGQVWLEQTGYRDDFSKLITEISTPEV